MKKILIISYLFPPENKIGALRAEKLSKYLSYDGVEVDILTKKDSEMFYTDALYLNNVIRISHSKYFITKQNSNKAYLKTTKDNNASKNTSNIKEYRKYFPNFIKKNYRQFLTVLKSIDFYIQVKNYIKNNNELFSQYDSVLTTYGPVSNHLCGNYIKKHYNVKWITDFRDPMTNQFNGQIFNAIYFLLQNKFCDNADFITTVSSGYLDRIVKRKNKIKSKVLPNGYDLSDKPKYINSVGFSFSYVGSLYEGNRKLSPLFKAIRLLIDENIIDSKDFIFNYAGDDFHFLSEQAESEGLQNNLSNSGRLSREKCIELQSSSRYLVLSTWNFKDEIGVFPGKFLEYMLLRKPIIALVDGDHAESEVKKVMSKAKLGITYEEACRNQDFMALKNYVKKEYLRYKKGLQSEFSPDKNELDKYNYSNISKQFEKLL